MDKRVRHRRASRVGVVPLCLLTAGFLPGCSMVPRTQFEDSQRLAQSLRAENARLKDEAMGLKAQNRDYADRALDDLRRLTARDEAIERLEESVQGYQDDRDRLAEAYRRLAVSLGRTTDAAAVDSTADRLPSPPNGEPVNAAVRRARVGAEIPASKGDGEDHTPRSPVPPGDSDP